MTSTARDVNAGSREDVDLHRGVGKGSLFWEDDDFTSVRVAAILWREDVDRDDVLSARKLASQIAGAPS